ncbi:hypothetical protein TVAG_042460 [Trichomonas vaginalis G3]|uniref:Uncharacterized protein n=1 Tax=Trichomonas vaginalis (strain ATCC PRA-98 / G3) TaxID=412133 RepID=A2GTY3_TRIV3|nr:hypothetical protein TVAGG3_0489630 [Trichomonas vaginalis G3]EAX79384.1 hypothetical protein TVAG_042460 [Trichomonas vaginalis G3]KAI5516286.1 hypothetical protein TVAGG3_0489630 [Trichomonas vaginalis G3]|eukprot:XP_001292314.1 hypothetical protein [Trichomonas vaginalis G3]
MNENSRPRIPNEWVRYMYEKLESGELTYATVLKQSFGESFPAIYWELKAMRH